MQALRSLIPSALGTSQPTSSLPTTSNAADAWGSSTTIQEDPVRTKARRLWYSDLMAKLATFRGIKPTPIEDRMYLAELEKMRFSSDQARLAELWILHGNWVYRGKDARLEMSDFQPDIKDIQYLIDQRKLVVMTKSAYHAAIRKAQEDGQPVNVDEIKSGARAAAESRRRAVDEVRESPEYRLLQAGERIDELEEKVRRLEASLADSRYRAAHWEQRSLCAEQRLKEYERIDNEGEVE